MTSSNYLILSSIVFSIGFLGIFINRKNIIFILISIELMLLATNINFIGFSSTLNDLFGQIFALFVLVVCSGSSHRSCHFNYFFKKSGSISIDTINKLKG